MTRPDLVVAALAAAGQGWPVFPLLPGRKQPRPELTDWEARATLDPDRIQHWWARHPGDNVAIATGPAGLVVVDLDQARPGEAPPAEWPGATGGADVLDQLAARHGQTLAPTWTVATPSGGRHRYYLAPKAGGPWRNTAGRAGWHIDTRASGGYVVAPGSLVDGRAYLLVDDTPPVPLPGWLARLLDPPAPPAPAAPAAPPAARGRAGYATAALRGEVQRVLDAPPGTRNAALNRAAWNLARHIATGLLTRSLVEDVLCEAGRAAGGQTPTGVAATVRSAIDARLHGRQTTGADR
ncbi:MAG TPA: bifunctional DNA primase/polymerase [Acidimicrobiales bacterium]